MKARYSLSVLFVLVIVVLWWLTRPNSAPIISASVIHPPSTLAQTAPKTKLAQIAAPTAPIAPLSPTATASNPMDIERAALKASISDMISLLDANDKAAFMEKYEASNLQHTTTTAYAELKNRIIQEAAQRGQPSPQIPSAEEVRQYLEQGPVNGRFLTELETLKSIKDTPPEMNATGDEAEFTLDPKYAATLPGNPKKMYFHKEKDTGVWVPGAF